MRKLFIAATAITSMFLSTSVLANVEIKPNDLKRITGEVHEMTVFLDLSEAESNAILDAKKNLASANYDLVDKYGARTAEYKEARKPVWRDYQKSLFAVISKEDLKRFNQSKK
jgi:hypothetical protein